MNKPRVLIIGAGGIVGQHMRLHQPRDVEAVYTRTYPYAFYRRLRLRDEADLLVLDGLEMAGEKPDVIVNLAGENRPDIVEQDPAQYTFVNIELPGLLGEWCDKHGSHLIHASTQGVYDGSEPPYPPIPPGILLSSPVNAYGRQKLTAERRLADRCRNWTIARLTFVLGVRPLRNVGRANPFETMMQQLITSEPQRQVNDRWFSPLFAGDAAKILWNLARRGLDKPELPSVFNVGVPARVSRYDLAQSAAVWGSGAHPTPPLVPVSHDAFSGLAQRPVDTHYAKGSLFLTNVDLGISEAVKEYFSMSDDRAVELAMFFGCGFEAAQARLGLGFGPNHTAVAGDWRASNPGTDDEILSWYKLTSAYCWELSAYHADPGFNYSGMCRGITEHLKAHEKHRVLCLGDGIGDMTLALAEAGLDAVYHDLQGSRTQEFAFFRFVRRNAKVKVLCTSTFEPPRLDEQMEPFEAIIAHDFFEHVINVEDWARAVFDMLRPGGLFLAQNAFAIGDPDHGGSIPMHLARNNKYADDDGSGRAGWDTLLDEIGFERTGEGNWRRKPCA